MLFENAVTVDGNVCSRPEIKTTENGKKYARFSVCHNLSRKNPDGAWTNSPNFFQVMTWENTAERAVKLNKGDLVNISGSLRYNAWKDKEGNNRNEVFIQAENVRKIDVIKLANTEEMAIPEIIPEDEVNASDTVFSFLENKN